MPGWHEGRFFYGLLLRPLVNDGLLFIAVTNAVHCADDGGGGWVFLDLLAELGDELVKSAAVGHVAAAPAFLE